LRERGILALGAGSALALAAAAFAPAAAPDAAGRAALAQLAAHTGDAVWGTWNRLRRGAAPLGAPASAAFELAELEAAEVAPGTRAAGPTPAELGSGDALGPGDIASAALLSESRRLEAAGEPASAASAAADALARAESPARRVQAQFRGVELTPPATRARALTAEVRALIAAVRALDTAEPLELGVRTLAAFAGAPWDADFERDAHAVLRRWCAPDVRPASARIEHIGDARPYFALRRERTAAALAEHLVRARPRDAELAALCAERARFETCAALVLALGRAPARGESDVWQLTPLANAWFTSRSASDGSWTGFFVARADVEAQLAASLAESAVLPDGVSVDFRGDDETLGPALGPRTPLAGDEFAFTLRHRDPETFVRDTSRRQLVLRVALLVMAVFAAGAGVLMARALGRERRLAELKASFVANVSHELRTPLASILLMAENLAAGRPADESGRARYHALIRREALRLARLVDDVLDFSRLERGKPLDLQREPVDLAALGREWREDCATWSAEHGLALTFSTDELTGSATIDRDALRRVLFNLLDNARKHSGSRTLDVELAATGAEFCFSVTDHGRGIPAAQREHVFEPFARLAEGPDAAPGTGLGLAIAREIVHAHGGTITAREPAQGTGARFEVRVPAGLRETEEER
jgi:signal transduction histidine kinase